MNAQEYSRPVDLKNIQITDTFWKNEMELVRTNVIPYQWDTLNDRVEGAAPSYCMRNFKIAGKMMAEKKVKGASYEEPKYTFRGFEALPEDPDNLEDKFYGFVFQDSDFAKWIEAVGYSLTQHPDAELEKIADEAIDIVCAAQHENGYLDTYYIINGMDKIFTNLRDHHELYCFGHLAEGAIAYYEATGKDKLLKAVERYAMFIDSYFGSKPGKCKGYPGHEIAEMALFRLYEATGNDIYLKLGEFFIDERGKRPYYWDNEHDPIGKREDLRYHYHQAHVPVREQDEAVGHAVRAVYLYSGMADMARIKKDEALYRACEKLWDSITKEKMYITGGIGGTHIGEAFSYPYDLPNDTAYAETCASIGLVFFARRMLEIRPNSKYADAMELALHNGILSGMALDGKSFFYVNPLQVVPESCKKDERKFHVKPVRQKWFGCACCPPNLARLISSIGSYAFTEKKDTLFVHLYMGANVKMDVNGKEVNIVLDSQFPWNGKVSAKIKAEEACEMTIAFRIPGWCKKFSAPSMEGKKTSMKDGYLYVQGIFRPEEEITLNFPMEIRVMAANGRVREDAGKVALMRGPVVYCMEEADNGKNLQDFYLEAEKGFLQCKSGEFGNEVIVIEGRAKKKKYNEADTELYHEYKTPQFEKCKVKFIPYYTWANRGEGEMQVFVPVDMRG